MQTTIPQRQQTIRTIKEKARAYVSRFVARVKGDGLHHQAMWAITLVGLFTAYSQVGVVAGLGALGFELGRGVSERLKRPRSVADQDDQALFAEALALIEQMDEAQQQRLHELSDEIGVWPAVLEEALRQQRLDLVADFETLLEGWGDKLALSSLHTMLDSVQHQVKVLHEQQSGLSRQVAGVYEQGEEQAQQMSAMNASIGVLLRLVQTLGRQMERQGAEIGELRGDIQQQTAILNAIHIELATVRADLQTMQLQLSQSSSSRSLRSRRRRSAEGYAARLSDRLWHGDRELPGRSLECQWRTRRARSTAHGRAGSWQVHLLIPS